MYTVEVFKVRRTGPCTTTIRTFHRTVDTKAEAARIARKHPGALITMDPQPAGSEASHHLVQKVRGTWRAVTRDSRRFRPPYEGFQIRRW